MSSVVEVRGHGAVLSVSVRGYEQPDEASEDDANWLRCRVEVVVGPFRGSIEPALTTQDFFEFARQLHDLVGGKERFAKFETPEEGLTLKVERSSTGAARISGDVRYDLGPHGVLAFDFESDLSYLAKTEADLASVLQEFPVRA